MQWKKVKFQIFTKLCHRYPSVGGNLFRKSPKSDNYNKIIFIKNNLTYYQRKKGAILITLSYLTIINLFYLIFSLSFYYFLFFLSISYLIYLHFLDYHKNLIKLKEYDLMNRYQFLSLQLNILFMGIKNSLDKNLILIEILAKEMNLAVNTREIISKINLGRNFKEALKDLIFYSPSFNLNFQKLLEFNYNYEGIENVNSFHLNYENKYEIFINSLESRLSLYFFFSLFYPICILFISSTSSLNYEKLLIVIGFFVVIQKLFIQKVLVGKIHLIGGINTLNNEEKAIFSSFLNFFYHLSNYLIWNPPEIALYKSINKLNFDEKKHLHLIQYNFCIEFFSLKDFLNNFFLKINSKQIQIFYHVMIKIFNFDSAKGPQMFRNISILIKDHLNLAKKQEIIIKSSFFKIKIFKVLLGFILGILTPIIYRFQQMYQNLNGIIISNINIDFSFHLGDLVLLISISLIFIVISLKSFNKVYNLSNSTKLDVFVILLFLFCVVFSNILWNSLINF